MTRGEVWWARMPLPVGRRPVVLVSRDAAYAVKTTITVAEVSTTVRGIPSEVPLGAADGLPRRCAANADHLVTISKARLEARLAQLRPDKLAALDEALRFSLGLG
jgi:mRNA interferase MazF